MTRFLLTLLALLTGLAATGTPAAARICAGGDTEIGAIAALQGAERVAASSQSQAAPAVRREASQQRDCLPVARSSVFIPTVRLGADRALE